MSDLIDKKEFIAWLDNWFSMNRYYHPHSKLRNIPYGEVLDILERMPTVPAAPRWVRCEEERPEDLRVVIIHKKWDGEITLGYSYPGFTEEMKLWMCLKTPYNQYEVPWVGAGHVDYWMPLPEPPKEGE